MRKSLEPTRTAGVLAVVLALIVIVIGSVACSRPEATAGESDQAGTAADGSGGDEEGSGDKNNDKAEGKTKGKDEVKDQDEDEDEAEDKEEAVPVEVTELGRGRIETVLRFSTNLEAENEVAVVSQASRQLPVVALLVEEGDEVRKGQVLLRLKNDQLRTALERVEGQLAKAEREYERQTNLHEQQLISEQVYTEATYEFNQLQLALKDARRELGYTEVRAPISGTITERHVGVGDQVTPNQPLFGIVDFDSIVARVYVPEKELWRIRPGLEARVYAEGARDVEHHGAVERIAPRVDARSGTVKTTVSIPRSAEFLPGMYVSVELVTAVNDDAVLVPKKALIYDADQIYIFRVVEAAAGAEGDGEGEKAAGDRVERLLVEPRLEDRDNIEAGELVAAGDRIVVAGQAGLKNGSLVRLVGAAGESENEAPAGEGNTPANTAAPAATGR